MTTGIFRSMVLARAMAVEPIARALYDDHVDMETTPFSRKSDRSQSSARQATQSAWATAGHETAIDVDDANLP